LDKESRDFTAINVRAKMLRTFDTEFRHSKEAAAFEVPPGFENNAAWLFYHKVFAKP
jgi:hypothetical protein